MGKKNAVNSFGLWEDDYERSSTVTLLHYENDNDFVIKLLPKDAKHEIILYKTEVPNILILSDLWNEAKAKIDADIKD